MMKLVTNSMTDAREGKLTVWRTEGPLEEMALELSADLTSDGERLVVVDAAGCFDPSRISQAAPSVARNLHVIRTTPGGLAGGIAGRRDIPERENPLWPELLAAQQKTQTRRILIVGLLDHLYGREMLTRDAARALGRMKAMLEALTRAGMEVTVVCGNPGRQDLGARTYLVSSLCASAHEVHCWPLTAQQYVNGASSAIA